MKNRAIKIWKMKNNKRKKPTVYNKIKLIIIVKVNKSNSL